jgi:hypothetical protein
MKPVSHDPTPAPPTAEDGAEQLLRLWRQGQRPVVEAFLAHTGPLSAAQHAEVLRVDQRQRWSD